MLTQRALPALALQAKEISSVPVVLTRTAALRAVDRVIDAAGMVAA